eukprot:Skav227558  [mRNA]  locus=scaffold3241:165807:167362:+ [translate_table: standard]
MVVPTASIRNHHHQAMAMKHPVDSMELRQRRVGGTATPRERAGDDKCKVEKAQDAPPQLQQAQSFTITKSVLLRLLGLIYFIAFKAPRSLME